MSEKNYPHLVTRFSDGTTTYSFELNSNSEKTIRAGLNTVKDTISNMTSKDKNEFVYFDNSTNKWNPLNVKKISHYIYGTSIGSKYPVVKDGKEIWIPKELLGHFSKQQVGMPFTLGHFGSVVGVVTESWVEDDEVKVKVGIFDDITEEQKEQMKNMKGFSLGGTFS